MDNIFIEAQIETGSAEGFALPNEAVVKLGNTHYVLQLKEQQNGSYLFDRVEVKPGNTQDGMTQILNAEDFKNDAQFLTEGAFDLIQE